MAAYGPVRPAAESFHCIFDEVFPSSTGIIGVPFPAEKIVAAMPRCKRRWATAEHAEAVCAGHYDDRHEDEGGAGDRSM